MEKRFGIYKHLKIDFLQSGIDGYILVQVAPPIFESLKEAEVHITDPKNKLIGLHLSIIEENTIYIRH